MRLLKVLHTMVLDTVPSLHKKRAVALAAAVGALMSGVFLTVTALGRRLNSPARTKHNLKRIDRLRSNIHLKGERRPPPGVLGEDHPRLGPQVTFIGQQFFQALRGVSKELRTEPGAVVLPQRVQLMGQREDDVIMPRQKLFFDPLQPAMIQRPVTLRTTAVAAGMIPSRLIIPVRAVLIITRQRLRPTSHQGSPRFVLIEAQSMTARITIKGRPKDPPTVGRSIDYPP